MTTAFWRKQNGLVVAGLSRRLVDADLIDVWLGVVMTVALNSHDEKTILGRGWSRLIS